MSRAPQLWDRVGIVTGGSQGIGLAIASALVAEGASVTIAARTRRNLERAKARLEAEASRVATAGRHPPAVDAAVVDVRDAEAVRQFIDREVERRGGLDILVNNAGVGTFADVAELTPDDWRLVIETNLSGVFYACRAAIPHLRGRGGGWIINIGSLAGTNHFPRGAAYCASKAGVDAFSHALMQEVRHDGIRVSVVAPGSVDTEFAGAGAPGPDWKLAPEDVAQVVLDLIAHERRSLPSRVELRPSRPPR